MVKIITKLKNLNILQLIIIASLCLVGLFNEYLSCIVSIALVVLLLKELKKENWNFKFKVNLTSVTIILIVTLYGFSSIWAVDSGMAILGFIKYLPSLLFIFLLNQKDYSSDDLLEVIPGTMTVMTVVAAILMQFDIFEKYFSVAGRISGFLQYSNTYALLALIALIVEATREKLTKIQIINVPILIFGIIYSGSRTVFVLTALVVLALVVVLKNKRIKFSLLGIFVIVIVGAVIYATVTGKFYSIGRFLTISLTESTFVGRFLYWQDAFKLIIRHPFGTGYMGFYYLQQTVQTGVYSIRYVHNDFLQLMLDIGWIPAVLLVVCIAKAFFKKGNSIRNRLILFSIFAHSNFDFDLQFVAVFMLLIALLYPNEGKEYVLRKKGIISIIGILLVIVNIYFGLALTLSHFNAKNISAKIYPYNTEDNIYLLTQISNAFDMDKFADKLLKQNEYLTVAYDAKALYAYAKGNIDVMVKYKDKAITYSPFLYEEYYDYCEKCKDKAKEYYL